VASPQLRAAGPLCLPGWGWRRLYQADLADQHTFNRNLGVPMRTYFGVDARLATTLLPA
jgi:hypothetical protein